MVKVKENSNIRLNRLINVNRNTNETLRTKCFFNNTLIYEIDSNKDLEQHLDLNQVNNRQSGVYVCQAENSQGAQESNRVFLNILPELPRATDGPSDSDLIVFVFLQDARLRTAQYKTGANGVKVRVGEGDDLNLSCWLETNIDVNWRNSFLKWHFNTSNLFINFNVDCEYHCLSVSEL
jgi:hypothetical protein